jgi:hypothetical protein
VAAALAAFVSLPSSAADVRTSFPTLEDSSTQAGLPIHKALEGDSSTNKNAHGVFTAKKQSDGNFVYMLTDDDGRLITSALTGFGANFSFGDVVSSTTTEKVVRRTTYTEQTVNAQRSFSSANANDDGSPAGTGARTITLTYYTATGTGPFTETLTLNGTGCVATVASNIAFVENIKVTTVGSTGSNVGIISMFVNAACGGGTIGTIAATNNSTFWAHHYVPTGKTANVTGISAGATSTTVGCGSLFVLKSKNLSVSDAVEIQVSDFVRLYGQSSTFARNYQSPIKVTGPARLALYATPECTTSTTYRASIDFFEP